MRTKDPPGELSYNNAGHEGHVRAGNARWMSAGKGLLHDEMPGEQFLKRGSTQELLQCWIIVPKANKSDATAYQLVRKEQQPQVLAVMG